MAGNRDPRPSTDQETAPLLQDPDTEDNSNEHPQPSYAKRIASAVQEPLTPLTQVLLVVALILLLLSSIFIGLFAGAQHRLNVELGRHGGEETPPATTITATSIITTETQIATTTTATSLITTETQIATTTTATSATTETQTATTTMTATSVTTETQTATTTSVYTSVIPAPPVPTNLPEETPCNTPQCILLSASILTSLDTTQDPCENFYQFSTGGWIAAHPLPADKGIFGAFTGLSQQNQRVIQNILESNFSVSSTALAPSYDDELLGKLRGLYASCMDEDMLNDLGAGPLFHLVRSIRRRFRKEDINVDWDDEADKKQDDRERDGPTSALAFLHSYGVNALFTFMIDGDVGVDPNQMSLWFYQPELGLPSKEYYKDEIVRDVYEGVLERLLLTFSDEYEKVETNQSPGLVVNEEGTHTWPPWPWPPWGDDGDQLPRHPCKTARHFAKKILEFETEIAKASLDLDKLHQDPIGTYNPRPLSNLTDSLPQINFAAYFATLGPRSYPENVVVTYPSYPAALSDILHDTSSDVLEAYLVIRTALTFAPYLGRNTEAWKAVRSLDETLKGIKKGAVGERTEFCVGRVEEALGFAAGRYFVNETFGEDSREKGTKVITDIVKAFKSSLTHLQWMDKESADAAAEKADAIRVKVGFPLSPDTRDPYSLAQYYKKVNIEKHSFFDNMLSAAASEESVKWSQVGQKRNDELWEMYPSMVNAYFSPSSNEIVFPAGILQPPFFSREWPTYLSYGAFGQVAAHELTHAFDSAGRLYNQNGKLEQWWTNSTSEGFQVRQDCIVNQYSSYSVDDGEGGKIFVNGNLTSGENIGDTGLIQAFRAWKAQLDSSFTAGNDYILPGLDYTREQLFFISFARIWAQNIRPASAVQRVRTDPHSPNRFRVDGTVYNIPEFAKAFNCPKKAKLNPPPEQRCLFW